jgi:hypothetical protein
MKPALIVLTVLLPMLACSSSDPKYSTKIETIGEEGILLRIDSVTSLSERDLKAALLREAARATIDRGRMYLRIGDLSTSSSMDVKQTTTPGTTGYPAPAAEPGYTSRTSVSRSRSGTIRFTIHREEPGGERVFDASRLLDQVSRGELPSL